MYLKGIGLKNFRNISNLTLELHPRFNIFVGSNAQGKTNILEAIYLLSSGRSFRVPEYKDMIQWGKQESLVRSWIWNPLGEEERVTQLTAERKKIFKNGKVTNPNQFQSMPAVLFAPEEILLLKDSPQARRDYVDGLLSKLSSIYGEPLQKYKRVLKQRNKLLKNEALSREEKKRQMMLWESPLMEHGKILIRERQAWLDKLNWTLERYYQIVGGDDKKAAFFYKPNVGGENFYNQVEVRREEELGRGISLVGPHRDDFVACLNSQPIRTFGSQGEMRTFTLALKLSEIELFEQVLNQSPILLLDDVLSELDEKRSSYFFSYLQKYKAQVFATATSFALFPPTSLGEFLCWEVREGKGIPFTF